MFMQFRTTPEWSKWLAEKAEELGVSKATYLSMAAAEFAKANAQDAPPARAAKQLVAR